MNTNLLFIPFRETIDTDIGGELRLTIKQHFFQTPSSFETDLRIISKLRRNIASLRDITANLKDLNQLNEYFYQLNNLLKVFSDDALEFTWFGTLGYRPMGPQMVRSFRFEQLNIVYQTGSLYSQLALSESRYSDKGLKDSCSHFQLAAGCFQYLIEKLHENNGKLLGFVQKAPDMDISTLECLKWLMLAQAQETVWQKGIINASMKDSAIAKLSIQISQFYSSSLSCANSSDYIRLEWVNHIAIKKYHFQAAANYRASLGCLDNFKYGDQVGYLRVASKCCEMAQKHKKYVDKLLLEDIQGLAETVKQALRVAEKENDLVYLKVVPDEKDLTAITGVSMVKALIPEALSKPKGSPLFKELIPFAIIQIAQAYKERQGQFVQLKIVDPINALNKMMAQFLSSRNLPASIDTLQRPENLPDSIVQHSQDILKYGGVDFVENSLEEISHLAAQSRDLLLGCQERLKAEAHEDELLSQRVDISESDRIMSQEAGADLYTKVQKMNEYLSQAQEGDNKIAEQYYKIKSYLEIYCGGYDELIKTIPNATFVNIDPEDNKLLCELRNALNDAETLKNERSRRLKDIEVKTKNNSILPSVVNEYKTSKSRIIAPDGSIDEDTFTPVYDKHITMFDPDLKFVNFLKEKQENLEEKINSLNTKFVTEIEMKYNLSRGEHLEILQTLESAYVGYLDLISNMNDGSKFYTDFLLRGGAVLKDCDDFIYRRRIEAREIEQLRIQHKQGDDLPNGVQQLPLMAPQGTWDPKQGIKFG